MEELTGYVDHIIYRNADNGYTVFEFVADEELIPCTGVFPVVGEGENLLLRGEFTTHPTYGEQFKVKSYDVIAPQDEVAMERYLASGAIKGIGVKMAAKIVKKFGADTFRIMEEEPERLAEVKGISERKAMEIVEQVVDAKEIRSAMIFLDKYGIHSNMAIKVFGHYGNEIYNILQSNPYKLADEISGIGFKMADEIAGRVGIRVDSEFRVKSGIAYTLSQAAGRGHTYLPQDQLVTEAADLLGVDAEVIETQILNLIVERKIVRKESVGGTLGTYLDSSGTALDVREDAHPGPSLVNLDTSPMRHPQIYLKSFYNMEDSIAGMLHALNQKYRVDEKDLLRVIGQIEDEEGMELDELQRSAVVKAASHGLFVLTGGPGTGKTTTIKTLIRLFEKQGYEIALAAPTGRAAKRMSETTGCEAKTIHRMLEVTGSMDDDDGISMSSFARFERNETNPLEFDVIIIDEMSMVDVSLMYALLKAVDNDTRLILVGDVYQLPSVGPGTVLRDLLDCDSFASVKLEKIFRQAAESDIVVNAHKIHQGERMVLDNKSKDFFFLKREDADTIISVMLTLVKEKMPKYVDASVMDIQVLTPTRKGLIGVERLNGILQKYLNPPSEDKAEWTGDTRIFREGDKVMQIKNNYQLEWEIKGNYNITVDKGLGVFNGDVGIIKEINDYSKLVVVEYDEGRIVNYNYRDLDELELAYAITIHKAQGSEYPAVVMPVMAGPRMLMNRNILYTAITRAKKCVTMVGDANVFYEMIDNTSQAMRYSGLSDRLKERAD